VTVPADHRDIRAHRCAPPIKARTRDTADMRGQHAANMRRTAELSRIWIKRGRAARRRDGAPRATLWLEAPLARARRAYGS
jgi:hypothetical protein